MNKEMAGCQGQTFPVSKLCTGPAPYIPERGRKLSSSSIPVPHMQPRLPPPNTPPLGIGMSQSLKKTKQPSPTQKTVLLAHIKG